MGTVVLCDLDADELLMEIEMLDPDTSVFNIGFTRCAFDAECAKRLFSRCPNLNEIHLNQLEFDGIDLATVEILSSFIGSQDCHLQNIVLGPNKVAEGGIELLANGLISNKSIVTLDISNIDISVAAFSNLIHALQCNVSIQYLNLSYCNLQDTNLQTLADSLTTTERVFEFRGNDAITPSGKAYLQNKIRELESSATAVTYA